MLDTDVCIYVQRRRPGHLLERFELTADKLCISTVTLAELRYGAEKSERRQQNLAALQRFVARVAILPFSLEAAAHFGEIRADLERSGTPIGAYDLMIAAQARSEGLILVTNNTREFGRVAGLRVENWI